MNVRILGIVAMVLLAEPLSAEPAVLDLSGPWQFRLDPDDIGEEQRWFSRGLAEETIALPGTTDLAGKGFRLDAAQMKYRVDMPAARWPSGKQTDRADERGFLVRTWHYLGKAWYQRNVQIPSDWAGRGVRLQLERVLWQSHVWVDGQKIGSSDSLVAPHTFDLGPMLPGPHRLTICIDNRRIHPIGLAGHAYGAETQTRWNGVVGQMTLTANDPIGLSDVQVYPAADRKTIRVRISAANQLTEPADATVHLRVEPTDGGAVVGDWKATAEIEPGEQMIEAVVKIKQPVESWDEFQPTRYRLTTSIRAGDQEETEKTLFGFRHIERDGRALRANGRRIFLRGTLDCCVYPNTGHPPVTVDAWQRVLKTAKEYGFNHVRFHTWCPPDAAFEAADRLGIYLCPETPFWVDDWIADSDRRAILLGHDADVTEYIRREIRRISDAYGNHPSFAFFCIGNEFGNRGTKWDVAQQLLAEAKQHDGRRLYNASTARRRVAADDFWTTHNSGKSTRGIGPPHTNWDFDPAAKATDLPVIAHETGQRPIFPNYDKLLPKFTGPLKPYNLVRLRDQLAARGLADQVGDFERASAKFQFIQYKAEHEGMHRTSDYAGYQLLMFNDFTGQSEALVGIVDPFWESKGVIRTEQVRQWNAPTVALARFDQYVWMNEQTFAAAVEVSHFGPTDLLDVVPEWSLVNSNGETIDQGKLDRTNVPTGRLTRLGNVEVGLSQATAPTAMTLTVHLGNVSNQWSHWVYPTDGIDRDDDRVLVARRWDRSVEKALEEGRRVLLLVHGLKNDFARQTGFASVYWSAGWWGNAFSSLGIHCNPNHPALALFPNDGHSDWQWHELTEGATTLLLDSAPRGAHPIVQPVTDFHHNHLLGQVFEARVGEGKLLVCGYDLELKLHRRHAARQFRRSLLSYVRSDAFEPDSVWTTECCRRLLSRAGEAAPEEAE